jgi:two-component system sensor histidine kinase RegB
MTTGPERSSRFSAAMRLDPWNGTRPWYMAVSPLDMLPWLVRLRWATAALEAAAVVIAWSLPRLDLPLDHLSVVLIAAAAANVGVAAWLNRGRSLPQAAAAGALALDIVLLTGLLELTGGPLNPFAVVYAVQLTLAALTLDRRWTAVLAGFAAGSFGVLLYWHLRERVPGHHRLNDLPTHLFTLWISAVNVAELVSYFVVQVSGALARREDQIDAMRRQAAKSDRIVALTTLAAGAAHELSTPLATIALAARELERHVASGSPAPALAGDAHLIRAEVDRCQAILDHMSGRAGGAAADTPELLDPAAVVSAVRGELAPADRDRVELRAGGPMAPIALPRSGLMQAVRALIKNACDATAADDGRIIVTVAGTSAGLIVTVDDAGPGMPADVLQRAGEPFFTTKEPGRGLGLGLFLARAFAERLGGRLTLASDRGTSAVLELPAVAPVPESPQERI